MSSLKIKNALGEWEEVLMLKGDKGDKGIQGDTGNGISSAVLNSDYTLTITFTDGTSYTTPSIRGEKGIKGDVGNGIASTVLNNDYTLTINFTDGTQYTTPPIRGKQGEQGIQGQKGDKGDTGETGATPNLTIGTVQTLAPSQPATATITGTAEEPVLNLGIPKGGKGDTGEVTQEEFDELSGEVEDALNDKAPVIIESASGSIASFSDGADDMPMNSLVVDIDPVQSGSGDPSPDNVRPISGWTGCEVRRTGKNLFDINRVQGTPIPTTLLESPRVMETNKWYKGLRADNYYYEGYANCTIENNVLTVHTFSNVNYGIGFPISCKPNTTYTISAEQTGCNFSVGCYDKDWNFLSRLYNLTTYVSPFSFTTPSNAKYITIVIGSVVNGEGTAKNIQLELGSTATDYEPYQGNTYSVDWTSEAGTVYGGTIDVVSGELVVDRAIVDLGTLNWNYRMGSGVGDYFYSELQGIKFAGKFTDVIYPIISSYYKTTQRSSYFADKCMCVDGVVSQSLPTQVQIKDSSYTDPTTFKAAMSGVQLVYELATPITYHLTPTEVQSIFGQNHVWADTGDCEVEYRADTKLYIQRLTQPDTADMIADANITSGQYFMVGNSLYKATANIANGGQIIVGTNCTRKSLSEALNEINS